jgi:DNA adenine methylase
MAYLGGKSKCSEHIIEILNDEKYNDMNYIEPFVGYCHILRRVKNKKTYTASDNNKYLIALLKHNQENPNSHYSITKEEHTIYKTNPDLDILKTAYAGFCYSYNGIFLGSYVNIKGKRVYPEERKRYYDSLYNNPVIKKTSFSCCDYTEYNNVKNALIYCDPPYQGTTEYHSSFDSTLFWEWVRRMSKNNVVYVSEYTAPEDFECVSEKEKYNSFNGKGCNVKRKEKLWIFKSLEK